MGHELFSLVAICIKLIKAFFIFMSFRIIQHSNVGHNACLFVVCNLLVLKSSHFAQHCKPSPRSKAP